jgi:polysaccharide biosynthesis transport protein
MLPGTVYSPEDMIRIARRRKWLLLGPLALGTAIAVGIGQFLPDKYRSEATIMLLQQRIPDNFVRTTVTPGVQERLTTLTQQILSRSRLERIVLEMDLYAKERRVLPMEDVLQRMRDDISKPEIEEGGAFRIRYVGGDPKTVQRVTARLAALFIEENTRERENLAEDTTSFMDAQVDEARIRLIAQEKRLEEYRRTHAGELPSQGASNLQVIQSTRMQIQSLAESEDNDRARRLLLERQLADFESQEQLDAETEQAPSATAQQLATARENLRVAESRLKPDHPDLRFLRRSVSELEAKLEAEKARPPEARSAEKPRRPSAELARQRRVRDLKDQIDDIDRQLRNRAEQTRRLQGVIADYQARLDASPRRESELVELTRDYETLRRSYENLLEKKEASKLAVNLERRKISEQFRILDSPKEAKRPYTPNRPIINLAGAAAGLAIGILWIWLLEYRDSTFKSETDIVRVLDLPVLALIPAISSDLDNRTRRKAG